jgi:hypothetical protein
LARRSPIVSAYIGRVSSRATPLASTAAAIRPSTIGWPATISMTMMRALIGPCVVAARKPTMPSAMSGIAASRLSPKTSAPSLPGPAPMASEGENTPPGTPLQGYSQVAQKLSSVWTAARLAAPCPSSIARVGTQPAPAVVPPLAMPITATASAQPAAMRSGKAMRPREKRSGRPRAEPR